MTSGLVNRSNFLGAIHDRLAQPLAAAGEGALLDEFKRTFDGAHFRKGLEVGFVVGARGRLTVKLDGEQARTFASPLLARSLLEIYVGGDPVSRDAKAAWARGLASMVCA